jgi:hypothetical protein
VWRPSHVVVAGKHGVVRARPGEFRNPDVTVIVTAPDKCHKSPGQGSKRIVEKKLPWRYHLDAANIERSTWLVRNGTEVAIALSLRAVCEGGPNGPGWRRGRNVSAPCANGAAISE